MTTIASELRTETLVIKLTTTSTRLLKIAALGEFLQDLDLLHRACFYLSEESMPRASVTAAPRLVLVSAHIGSVELQLVEQAMRTGAPYSAAVWLLIRALRRGPGQLSEWAAVALNAQEARAAARTRTANQKLKLLREEQELVKAQMALVRIQSERDLTLQVTDADGRTVQEPPGIQEQFGP